MLNIKSMILNADNTFLYFLSFTSKYFSNPIFFLYVLNFGIFSSDFICFSKNCSHLSFNLFLIHNNEAELKVHMYYDFPKHKALGHRRSTQLPTQRPVKTS